VFLRSHETCDGFVTQWNLADGCGRGESGVGGLGWRFIREFKLVENRRSRSRFLAPDQLVVCSYLRTVQNSVYYATRRILEYEFFSTSS